MDRIAFVFPGQGAQYPGMGKALYESERELFDGAEKIRPGITKLCFEGTPDELKQTEITQPCMYLAEAAAARSLVRAGVTPDAAAGFSLGEITALAAGGAYSYEEGFGIVCRRSELMAECADKAETGMAAVLKLSREEVERICGLHPNVYAVNYNCPGQIAVAGMKGSLEAACVDLKAAGARIVPLAVSGGFHSPFMDEAASEFAKFLADQNIGTPRFPVWSDSTGLPYGGEVMALMAHQIDHPVLWEDLIRRMAESGINVFVEAGPGQVLSRLIRKILPDARICHAETPEEIASLSAEVRNAER